MTCSRTAVLRFAFIAAVLLPAFSCCRKPQTSQPPVRPAAPTGITSGRTITLYWFKASTTDPDDDSVCFRFRWDDGVVSGWSDWVASGETAAMWHAWPSPCTLELQTQAKDQQDSISVWSAPLTVSISTIPDPHPPETPARPAGKAEAGRHQPITFSSRAQDPDGDSVCIRFAWGDGDTSEWSSLVGSGELVSTAHSWQLWGDFPVQAQARDKGGLVSDWSSAGTITIGLLRWRFATGDVGTCAPSVAADGTVYIGSYDGFLYAINPDGSLKWRYEAGSTINADPALADDGTIYIGSRSAYLHAVNPDGSLRWRKAGLWIPHTAGVAADGTVYIWAPYRLNAIKPDSNLKWSRSLPVAAHYSGPSIAADGTIYITSDSGYVYALNPDSTMRWCYKTGGIICGSPAVAADGTVYVGSYDRYLYAINPDGTVKWRYQAGLMVGSSAAVAADGSVIIASMDSYLYTINPDGSLRWRFKAGGPIQSSPALSADGTVYVGSDDYSLYAVYPDGTLKWRYQTEGSIYSSPAVAPDGTVYFESSDGYLYALDGDSPLADAPWPKYHHDNMNTGRVGGGR
jgi:outer membrane protein assembly factor BamB